MIRIPVNAVEVSYLDSSDKHSHKVVKVGVQSHSGNYLVAHIERLGITTEEQARNESDYILARGVDVNLET